MQLKSSCRCDIKRNVIYFNTKNKVNFNEEIATTLMDSFFPATITKLNQNKIK